MRAAAVLSLPSDRFAQVELPDPSPAPGEIVLEVEACGICGTDLHILAGRSYAPALPFVLGHEPAGRVVMAASDAAEWLGRRVVITLFTGCGACEACRAGDERLCEALVAITGVLGRPGGFAERLAVRAAQAVEVPDGLDPAAAASLVDAGATAANAVRQIASRRGRCVILGGGPVGFLAAELCRAQGRDVVVVEPQPARRAALAALEHVVHATTGSVPNPDVVVDCAADADAAIWALAALRPRGTLVVVGYGPVPAFDSTPIARKELVVVGVRSGSRADLEHVLELAATGRIRLPAVARYSLDRIDEGFAALRAGAVAGKAVIVP